MMRRVDEDVDAGMAVLRVELLGELDQPDHTPRSFDDADLDLRVIEVLDQIAAVVLPAPPTTDLGRGSDGRERVEIVEVCGPE